MESVGPRVAAGGGSVEPVRFAARGDFVGILDRLGLSLVAATDPNHVVLLGAVEGALTTSATFFFLPFGLAVDGDRLAISTSNAVFVFGTDPRLAAGFPGRPGHFDAYFVPRTIHVTGECRMHEIVFARHAIIAANTSFSCICRLDGAFNFTPLWRPPFVTELMGDDRCHLNGFTGENEELSYVTALGVSDRYEGWRQTVDSGGVLIDARRNAVLRSDLCLPHSPRLIGGELYVLNGGEGEVLRVDRGTGESAVVARLPAFTHGLCHHAGILFVGMSKNRGTRTANPPPVARREADLQAGIAAIDMRTGRVLGSVVFDGVNEVYDVQVLPGVRRAGIQSLVGGDPYDGMVTPERVFWMRSGGNLTTAAATGNYRVTLDIAVNERRLGVRDAVDVRAPE